MGMGSRRSHGSSRTQPCETGWCRQRIARSGISVACGVASLVAVVYISDSRAQRVRNAPLADASQVTAAARPAVTRPARALRVPAAVSATVPTQTSSAIPREVRKLLDGAYAQIGVTVSYDASYSQLAYPGGDVDISKGVCTDVIVRAYRAIGIDLQRLVHEDMRRAFSKYPKRWGLTRPDANIDHRRVPNLQTFLTRTGASASMSNDPRAYQPGDLVTWTLGPLPHIGIVSDRRSASGNPLVVHNVGRGTLLEDVLFTWPITGHYRWMPSTNA